MYGVAASRDFARNHSILTYFAFTCVISWGCLVLFVLIQGGLPATWEEVSRQMPVLIPAVLGGPSLGAILAIALISGIEGFRELFARLRRWRVDFRWYAAALLTAPLVFVSVHLVLSTISPDFRPAIITASDWGPILLMGVAGGLVVGFFEELGWTGFATPRLRRQYGMTTAGLLLGMMWVVWHFPFQRGWPVVALAGDFPLASFLVAAFALLLIGQLLAYRVLMVWVYEQTDSLPLAILMHTSLTSCSLIIGPATISGFSLLVYDVVLGVAWWLVVAIAAVARRRAVRGV